MSQRTLSAIEQQEQKRRTGRAEEIRYTVHNRVIYIVVLDGEGRTFLTHFSHIESAGGRALSLKALRIFEQASGQGLGFHDPKIVCMRPSEFIHEYGNYFLSVNLT
ncbi:MAG TPA: hypothetical protein VFF30_10340 [Nitrososphaerales archaeon]|nr:hypothetical protein [Nitrososphaerales archaeon]